MPINLQLVYKQSTNWKVVGGSLTEKGCTVANIIALYCSQN